MNRVMWISGALAALLGGCVVGDVEDQGPGDVEDQGPGAPPVPAAGDETVGYSTYICNLLALTPEGECSTTRACSTNNACATAAYDCYRYGYRLEQYAIILDGSCACYSSCDPHGDWEDSSTGGRGDGTGGNSSGNCVSDWDCPAGQCCSGQHYFDDGTCNYLGCC
jgi:hypothetical protein